MTLPRNLERPRRPRASRDPISWKRDVKPRVLITRALWLVLGAAVGCGGLPSAAPGAAPITAGTEARGTDSPSSGAPASTAAASGAAGSSSSRPSEGPPLDAGLLQPGARGGAATGDAGLAPLGAIKGVCWNPVAVGTTHPEGLDYPGFAPADIPLMVELGVNVVRTYEPLLDPDVLDQLWAAGIRVIESIYPWGGVDASVVTERVRRVKDHPAVLFYALGNEWNYNGLYVGLSPEDSLERLNEAARLVRAEDPNHPIATIYGELPSPELIAAMPDIDVWGINAYRGLSFGDLFDSWRTRSDKPMFIAEYGADSYNANLPGYDPDSQALAAASLTREILEQSTRTEPGAAVLGGTIFEWADEWWKDAAGSLTAHEVGGIAPGGGPYPDQVFNEEWWGLVDIERTPRPAYESLRAVFAELRTR